MPVSAAAFDFHGARAVVRCEDSAALAELRRDFAYFESSADTSEPGMELELRPQAPPAERRPRRPAWRWRSAGVSERDGVRVVDYEGRALLEYDLARERGVLWSAEPALLHELAYLALLSRVGERLDLRGLHRVHALGFSYRGGGGLLLLPSGGGKSRLGLELLGREHFRLLSDDIPLITDGGLSLVCFPTRLGLRGDDARAIPPEFLRPFSRRRFGAKTLVDLAYFRAKVGAGAPLRWLLIGERGGAGAPGLSACSAARAAAALGAGLVLGVGTPQVLELMAPAPPYVLGAARLASIALRRAGCAARAVASARRARFRLSSEPGADARALEAFLAA